ncbi:Asp23/Gls24 family envelope stress response protein [Quadrisphaera setariae]|uniref:Asp23/Gls24 family envelope stress response protein n=1 Tax=Quadrisphaera setariae TaxID=2593304 RepID=A0A5C8ZIR3_9ACTN|nr:Asp23/Gls24 family envelope stress response protein [Quadrisphaera setariae]TXR57955.1 Asp23/Gls24 family envelope stress response protein [Quadrisphaera setariae]
MSTDTSTAPSALPEPQALPEPGSRGSLQVAERVVVAIARAAAMEVTGVATTTQNKSASKAAGLGSQISDQLTSAVGRTLPRASAQVAGHRARITLEVALVWPHPAAQVAQQVREHVTTRLAQLAAVETDAVTVTISAVVRDQRATATRRVQ